MNKQMITVHYETKTGLKMSVTVSTHEKYFVCKDLLDKGYYLVGESIPNE